MTVSGTANSQPYTFTVTRAAGSSTNSLPSVDYGASDTTPPSGYTVSLDQDPVTSATESAVSFTFAGAETGTSYSYTITSSGGGTAVTGAGTISTAAQQITGIDVSGLADGTLTLSVTLTDSASNTGAAATDTATKDVAAPSGYTVSLDQDPVTSATETAVSFTFAGAETGTSYSYTISSSGGGTPVTGAGTISTAAQQILGIDVSGLADGTLTLSVTLTDSASNTGAAATDTATKDAAAPSGYTVSLDQDPVTSATETAVSFTFAGAETGTSYSYTISSSGGGTPVTGAGTISTAAQQITGIDVSGLADGTLTLSVTLTDSASNTGAAATDTATKDVAAPSGYTVSLDQDPVTSATETAVSFTFAGAETGTSYSYTISSSGGGTPVTGAGTISTATQQITGIDVSGLADGTLTLSVTLTDSASNTGSAATDTATKDVAAPSGYTVSLDQDPVTSATETAVSFTFAGAETGTSYSYTISSSGGGTAVTGAGTISAATQQITGIDVSGLADGTLTLSVTLTDSASNTGSAATDTATKDVAAPSGYTVSLDQDPVTSATESAVSFTFAGAETGTSYSYTISSSGGGTAVTGAGTISAATQQITGIDVSGLADGTLTLSVTLTD
ncbi:beta strand repeat-containing protein, partial [Rhodobacter sp. TJ_12]|uniref:beta strand repeat-containing protein n=1 Tax=Rhodobacter sp. TJ_12 TaxID=2029399 RepID=UPI001CBAF4A9